MRRRRIYFHFGLNQRPGYMHSFSTVYLSSISSFCCRLAIIGIWRDTRLTIRHKDRPFCLRSFYQWFVHMTITPFRIFTTMNTCIYPLVYRIPIRSPRISNMVITLFVASKVRGRYHATIPITGSLPTEIGPMTNVEDRLLYVNEFTGSLSQRRYVCWRMLNICFLLMTSSRAPYQRRSTCWRMPSLSILTSTSSQVRSQRRSVYWRMSGSPSC